MSPLHLHRPSHDELDVTIVLVGKVHLILKGLIFRVENGEGREGYRFMRPATDVAHRTPPDA